MSRFEPAGPFPAPSRPGYLNSHLLFRMTRQLTQDGKPLPKAILLTVQDPTSGKDIVAGGLALTGQGMLCYWPPIPARQMRPDPSEGCLVDHATLDVENAASHLTCYDSNDARCRPGRLKSRLIPFPSEEVGYRVWLFVAVKYDVMRAQLGFFEEWISLPRTDECRRIEEVVSFAHSLPKSPVRVPEREGHHDFLVLELGLAECSENVPLMLPSLNAIGGRANGWKDPAHLGVNVCPIGDLHVAIRTFLPGGAIEDDVLIGVPRRR